MPLPHSPPEYLSVSPYRHGLFWITDREVGRYHAPTDRVETYSISGITGTRTRICYFTNDEAGEILCFVFNQEILLLEWHTKKHRSLERKCTPAAVYLDRHKVVGVSDESLSISDISFDTLPDSHVYKLRGSQPGTVLDALVCDADRTIGVGDRLYEIENAMRGLIFSHSLPPQPKQKLAVLGIALVKPEPVVFAGERTQEECFTDWGLVVVYETGAEVYAKREKEYHLQYVYKQENLKPVGQRRTVLPLPRVYVQHADQIVELRKDGPYTAVFSGVGEKAFITGFFFVSFGARIRKHPIAPESIQVVPLENPEHPRRELSVQHRLERGAEACQEALRKHRDINYAEILEGKEVGEQLLVLRALLNNLTSSVVDRAHILELALAEKLEDLGQISEALSGRRRDIQRKKAEAQKQANEIRKKVENILQKMKSIRNTMNPKSQRDMRERSKEYTGDEEESEEASRLRERIKTARLLLQTDTIPPDALASLRAQESLLRRQRSYLSGKIRQLEAGIL